jgi:HEAT repeat protein
MRKINHIWYAIWFVIGISIFILGCPFKSGVEGKTWFRYALKFDEARNIAMVNDAAKKGTAIEDLAEMDKLKQKFLHAKQPAEDEIISVLRSPNRRFQKVGLVAMSLKPIETNQLIDILFEFLQDQNREFRFYAVSSLLYEFTKFPESKRIGLGRQLLEIIKNEKDQELFIKKFSLFAKFPSEEAALFLTEQLMKEGEENYLYRNFAFNTLKEMGDSYYEKAAEYVNKHGSPEIKKELWEREKSWVDFSARIKNRLKK